MSKAPTTPVKITAHMMDGRLDSANGIIMFDAILYHAWFAKHAPHVLDGEGRESFHGFFGLPLRHLPGNCYAASKGIYEEISQSIDYINKRPDFFGADKIDYLNMDKGQISDSVGAYRAYRIPHVIRTIRDGVITFYAMGHRDGIEDLLSYIPAVGKKPVAGYGFIDSWSVEDVETDYSEWHPEYGLMRPLPVEDAGGRFDLTGYPVFDFGVRPPYWKSCNYMRCYVPV